MIPATEWKLCSICFLSFICEKLRTQTKFGIKNWNWHGYRNLIIFDLLNSPEGHQFDPRMKFYFSAGDPCRFDMLYDHVWIFFWPPWAPQCPQVPPLGHDQGDRMNFPIWYVFIPWRSREGYSFGVIHSVRLSAFFVCLEPYLSTYWSDLIHS